MFSKAKIYWSISQKDGVKVCFCGKSTEDGNLKSETPIVNNTWQLLKDSNIFVIIFISYIECDDI